MRFEDARNHGRAKVSSARYARVQSWPTENVACGVFRTEQVDLHSSSERTSGSCKAQAAITKRTVCSSIASSGRKRAAVSRKLLRGSRSRGSSITAFATEVSASRISFGRAIADRFDTTNSSGAGNACVTPSAIAKGLLIGSLKLEASWPATLLALAPMCCSKVASVAASKLSQHPRALRPGRLATRGASNRSWRRQATIRVGSDARSKTSAIEPRSRAIPLSPANSMCL